MKRLVLFALLGLMAPLCMVSAAYADEILHWKRLPLAVPLIVGQERVVFLDRNVRVGVPPSLGEHLRVQSAGGALYLRASDAVPPTRLQVQDVGSGALILLDVAAEPPKDGQVALEPIRIVDDGQTNPKYGGEKRSALDDADGPPAPDQSGTPTETPVSVVLTRYAAQTLYAPLRTVEPIAGIRRVNARNDLALNALLPTLPVRARILAAWRLDDQWVTAIRLTNTDDRGLELDPRALQGDFDTATFQHPNLGPSGQSTDTTVLYLVTHGHGLAQSLLPTIAPFDPAVNLPVPTNASETGGHDEE